MKKTGLIVLSLSLLIFLGVTPPPASGLDIQALIDVAQPGEVIRVPAGNYRVNLFLRAGVVLEGAGAAATVLDGGGDGPVITAEGGGVIKGFTIRNGIEGVKASGAPIGVFENIITGNAGAGIRVGGGDGVLINNLITGNRGAGIDAARARVLAVNNSVCGGRSGFSFWKCPVSTAVNNLVAGSETGLLRDGDSQPEFANNLLSNNAVDYLPAAPEGENFSQAAYLAGCRLADDSPFRAAGIPVEGVAAELTAGIGALLPAAFPLETYLEVMESISLAFPGERSLVEYELLEELGVFRVSTFFPRPEFKIASSTVAARIEEPVALDRESRERLIERLVPDEPLAVEVWGWGGVDYPREDERYVLESFFTEPDSYFAGEFGDLRFVRESNFPRIRVLIPEGYRVKSLSPEGEIDPAAGTVTISNPARSLVEVNLTLSPF